MTHISYSELKIWAECPFKHKLIYLDKIKKFQGNEFTAFGSALHSLCENAVLGKLPEDDYEDFFDIEFLKELEAIDGEIKFRKDLVTDMRDQARRLSPHILPALGQNFEDYEVFSVEERLYEDIPSFEAKPYKFKGFIDLVIKTGDTYHIIDWKTCSWGWDAKRRSDKLVTYQLTLYKHFFCQKHGIDPSKVETHFALLKRTAKKDFVEIFRVTSGPRKTENAKDLLMKALHFITIGSKMKNRNSCDKCEFRKTEHCQ
jgi:predicted RecB family nuclease